MFDPFFFQSDTSKLMLYSDQDVLHSTELFCQHLQYLIIKQSMIRRENCWDNYVIERFQGFEFRKTEPLSFMKHRSVVNNARNSYK